MLVIYILLHPHKEILTLILEKQNLPMFSICKSENVMRINESISTVMRHENEADRLYGIGYNGEVMRPVGPSSSFPPTRRYSALKPLAVPLSSLLNLIHNLLDDVISAASLPQEVLMSFPIPLSSRISR